MIVSLPPFEWPHADREAWSAACAPGERLRRGGRASHLRPVMQGDYARRYGYFLQVLQEAGRLDRDVAAGGQVTPENVELYVERARKSWGSVTLALSVQKLHSFCRLLDPGRDLAWLQEVVSGLQFEAVPRPLGDRLVGTEDLVKAGLTLVREAELATHLKPRRRALVARNGLMIALLALCPVRLRNLAELSVGTTFRLQHGQWWIMLPARSTKTNRADERPVPDLLDDALACYLGHHRPVLLGRCFQEPEPGPLWIGFWGEGLGYSAVNLVVTETTREALGVAVNPHAFRAAAASTVAFRAAHTPGLASAVLQHTDRRTTDAHYNRATSLQAGLELRKIIRRGN